MARFWLGPWVWSGIWQQPSGSVGSLDLRSLPQCAATVTPQGFGFFVTPNAVNLGSSYTNLGTDPELTLTEQQKRRWESALGLPATLVTNRLADIVYETLTLQADPLGDDRCLPLIPSTRRRFEVWLAGVKVRDREWSFAAPEFDVTRDLLKRIYRALREASQAGQIPADKYLRWLGSQVRKYGLTGTQYRALQPTDLPDEQPLTPETTIGDTFVEGSNAELSAHTATGANGGFAWTELAGDLDVIAADDVLENTATGESVARADQDLSSDDHYVQADITQADATDATSIGVIGRKDGTATATYYLGLLRAAPSDTVQMYKRVSGTFTQLGGSSPSVTRGFPDTIKLEMDGSAIKFYYEGVEKLSATDTAITGNLRTGVRVFRSPSDTVKGRWDNFQAADLAGSAESPSPTDVFRVPRRTTTFPVRARTVSQRVPRRTVSWSVRDR